MHAQPRPGSTLLAGGVLLQADEESRLLIELPHEHRPLRSAVREVRRREYRMTPKLYGRTLEIDHIVPLELGGSNKLRLSGARQFVRHSAWLSIQYPNSLR